MAVKAGRTSTLQEVRAAKALVRLSGAFDSVPSWLTGIIPSTGTTPTAGSGFTYTHTAASGIYVFTFATAMSSTPIVLTQLNAAVGTNNILAHVTGVLTTGFTVSWVSTAGGAVDVPFSFIVTGVQ